VVRQAEEAELPTAAAGLSDRLVNPLCGRTQDRAQARTYTALLAVNLMLNASWTWLFFTRRQLGTSAVAAAALTASSADLTRRAVAARGPSAGALAAYPAWCAFATVLSTRIWQLNRCG
jgi:translocator protein